MRLIYSKNLILLLAIALFSTIGNPASAGYLFPNEKNIDTNSSVQLNKEDRIKEKRKSKRLKSKKRFKLFKEGKSLIRDENFFGTVALLFLIGAIILGLMSRFVTILSFFSIIASIAGLVLAIGGLIKDEKKTRAILALCFFVVPLILSILNLVL